MLTLERLTEEYKDKSLEEVSQLVRLPFDICLQMLIEGEVKIRKPDLYWNEMRQGATLTETARKFEVKPDTVRRTLQQAGYKIASRPVSFAASTRLKDACDFFGADEVMGVVEEFLAQPELIVFENIGTEEDSVTLTLSLSPENIADLDEAHKLRFGDEHRRNRSLIVRQALERLIVERGAEQFKKPEGWQSRPINLSQGGKNPTPSLGESRSAPVHLPMWIYSRIEGLKDSREKTLSDFIRTSIMEADPATLESYIPRRTLIKGFETVYQATVVFPVEHLEKLDELSEVAPGANRSDLVGAAICQALDRQGDLAVKDDVWQLWQAIGDHGMLAALSKLDLTPQEAIELLSAANFIRERKQSVRKCKPVNLNRIIESIVKQGLSVTAAAREAGNSLAAVNRQLKPWLEKHKLSLTDLKQGRLPEGFEDALASPE